MINDPQTDHQWDPETKKCTCGFDPAPHGMSHLHIEATEASKPHIWIQWKGTNVCCDIHCSCGGSHHFDGDFFYFFRCPSCQQVWEVGTRVMIYKVNDDRAKGAIIQEPDL